LTEDEEEHNLQNKLTKAYDEMQKYLEELPEAEQPEQLVTPLLPHQRQGLYWLCDREYGHDFKLRGGILADEMGVGKTMQTIALMCSHLLKHTLIVCPLAVLDHWKDELEKHSQPGTFRVLIYHGAMVGKCTPEMLAEANVVITTYGTLISDFDLHLRMIQEENLLVPLAEVVGEAVAATAEEEAHNRPQQQRILPLNSTSRLKKTQQQRKPLLYQIGPEGWSRVVLDEAHCIKNYKGKSAKACCALPSHFRLCLTGTALCNKLDDLYSLLKFMHYEGYMDYTVFHARIIVPLSSWEVGGMDELHNLLRLCMLRRRKEQKLRDKIVVDLPPVENKLVKLELEEEDALFYKVVERNAVRKFKNLMQEGNVVTQQAHIWTLLLYMREAACHPYLIAMSHNDNEEDDNDNSDQDEIHPDKRKKKKVKTIDQLPAAETYTLATIAAQREQEAQEAKEDILVTAVDKKKNKKKRGRFNDDDSDSDSSSDEDDDEAIAAFYHKRFKREEVKQEEEQATIALPLLEQVPVLLQQQVQPQERLILDGLLKRPSTKLNALLTSLNMIHQQPVTTTPDKIVIYSQFTRYLDLIEAALKQSTLHKKHGWHWTRLDGTMSREKRAAAIEYFYKFAQCRIFLVSLKAGGVGINLTVANHIFVMDPWWNTAIEKQAIDRVNRIGQTKPVHVTRFVVNKTVEERALSIQVEKDKMIDRVLSNTRGDVKKQPKLTFAQYKQLFTASM